MNPAINLLKGTLIILVVIGHILPGTLDENIVRHFIYSFHMPLFIALSGYLINVEKLRQMSFGELLKKYALRAVIPWSIAVVVYFIYNNPTIGMGDLSAKLIIHSFYVPFYHLWYIPAFIGFVILTYFFLKIGLKYVGIVIIGAVMFLSFYAILKMPELKDFRSLIKDELHTFRPYYYLYFALGIFLRNTDHKPVKPGLGLTLLGFTLTITSYFYESVLFGTVSNSLFALGLTLWIIPSLRSATDIRNKMIEWLGVNSLAIYLWHILPMLVAHQLFTNVSSTAMVAIDLVATGIACIIIYLLTRIKWINRICFGNWN